ncbi:MAG: NAD-dependent epimerase/dehydratase family protein [Planctomycetes bacterium]|jgi:UDP-glucuronate decarboxylase|nr:NAD-dependent epimerase/dehydratase family protein [Planctomycetota bacterium]
MAKKVIFDKKNILVIGGAGFIGSHLCDELVKTSKVICVDNFCGSSEKNIDHLLSNPDFAFINHDASIPIDLEALPELKKFRVPFQGIQEIYNLACPTSPKHFLENRIKTLIANSLLIKNVLDWTVKYEAKLVHFSSSVVYGLRANDSGAAIMKEDFVGLVNHVSPRSSYDEGKRFAETMVVNYRDFYNIDAKIIRVFRTYGPRMELNDDQMIPDFVNNALDGNDLVIFGDQNFSSSFCYVSDVVDAAVKLMDSTIKEPLNIGSDVDVKLSDIAQMIITETKSQSKITYENGKLFMTQLCLPDIYRARNDLGWMPVVTLKNGLKKTIFDLQAHKRLRVIG